jgi:CubicO group peptidase (beta-lactamase class C family)
MSVDAIGRVADGMPLEPAVATSAHATMIAMLEPNRRRTVSPWVDAARSLISCAVTTIAQLLDAARADVESGWLPSCQLAVARDNELLVFETIGDATSDSQYCIFSCTKPIVASAVWLLIGDGSVDVTQPASAYVPELATTDLAAVTVEQVMLHTAGFPNAPMPALEGGDPARRRARFAQWRREWEPGSRFEYHAGSAHWVLVDLIERVSGLDFRDFVEQRVTQPLGLPRLLGIPEDRQTNIAAFVHVGDGRDEHVVALDEPAVRAVGVPGGGAIMRAADLALFYQGLLHNPGGLWDAAVLEDATTNVRCVLPDNLLEVPVNRSLGLVIAGDDGQHFMRYGSFGQANSPRSFGHAGAHGHVGWADPETGLSFAYCTNGIDVDLVREGIRGMRISGVAAGLVV